MESFRIPLFPLPMVLFPGTLVPLHIFEPRYREMVRDVMEGEKRFGLLYHDPDESGPFMNEEGQLGTVAEIRRHQPLPDGRSMLLVPMKGTHLSMKANRGRSWPCPTRLFLPRCR